MSQPFDFERPVELCRRTHEETRNSSVLAVARLAFSCDGHEIRQLGRQRQVIEKTSDLIKDPVVLGLPSLDERAAYSERNLATC